MSFGGAAAALNKTIKKNRALLRKRGFHNISKFSNYEFEGDNSLEFGLASEEERLRIEVEKKALKQRMLFKVGVVVTVSVLLGIFIWVNWM